MLCEIASTIFGSTSLPASRRKNQRACPSGVSEQAISTNFASGSPSSLGRKESVDLVTRFIAAIGPDPKQRCRTLPTTQINLRFETAQEQIFSRLFGNEPLRSGVGIGFQCLRRREDEQDDDNRDSQTYQPPPLCRPINHHESTENTGIPWEKVLAGFYPLF